jgi:hypothetical protein
MTISKPVLLGLLLAGTNSAFAAATGEGEGGGKASSWTSPEGVTAIATVLTALGLVFVYLQTRVASIQMRLAVDQFKLAADQLRLASQQFKEDHERSRRENAVNYLMDYVHHDEPELAAVRILVESLPKDACEDLAVPKEFFVDAKHKEYLLICLRRFATESQLEAQKESGRIKLNFRQANRIRSLTISYLNGLEGVLTAWREGVADADIIWIQFARHVVPARDNPAFNVFCSAIHAEDCYPSLMRFVRDVQKSMDAKLPGKAKALGEFKSQTL